MYFWVQSNTVTQMADLLRELCKLAEGGRKGARGFFFKRCLSVCHRINFQSLRVIPECTFKTKPKYARQKKKPDEAMKTGGFSDRANSVEN